MARCIGTLVFRWKTLCNEGWVVAAGAKTVVAGLFVLYKKPGFTVDDVMPNVGISHSAPVCGSFVVMATGIIVLTLSRGGPFALGI